LADRALERRETEHATVVVPDQELEKAVAKAADTVIEDQMGAHGFRRSLRVRPNHV
jgi:hypothetical protein